ncbi:MAG: hypothetical protein ACYC1M_02185 [Armatimonadota bacterium]
MTIQPVATVLLIGFMTIGMCGCKGTAQQKPDNISYIDNGKIKVGINLDLGGSITYISKSGSDVNLVNSADWGRQIQMSHYSGPNPFEPDGHKANDAWRGLGWNPIQSGDCYHHRSTVLAHKNDKNSLYVKCIPMQWPLNNVPGECTFECWITLKDNTVLVKSRMVNHRVDKTQYDGRDQELPAIYTNGPWWKLMTYDGDKPFTNDKLTHIPPVMPWKGWISTENWSALVNDDDWGLGIWQPGVYRTIGGFAGKPGKGGPKDGPTGYIAPLHREIIDHNIDYSYNYVLILGSLQEIRDYVYKQKQPTAAPNWVFKGDRQHWIYRNAVDTGWPIKGALNIDLSKDNPQLISPEGMWSAAMNPILYVKAAFTTDETSATIQWERKDAPGFNDQKSLPMPIIGDGVSRVYSIDLSKSPEYSGMVTRLQLVPSQKGVAGNKVIVRSIGYAKPSGK